MTTEFAPRVPGSRSVAARALICASLAPGASQLTNIPDCDDTTAIIRCLRGSSVDIHPGEAVTRVAGATSFAPSQYPMDCAASGTTMRFIAALSLLTDRPMTLTGTPRLMERPMAGLYKALNALGKEVDASPPHRRITGTPRITGHVTVDAGTSGQFVSGLIMALAASGQETILRAEHPASKPFIAMTMAVMQEFGAEILMRAEGSDLVFEIAGTGYKPANFFVETDVMSANYFLAAAAITGCPVFIANLRPETIQGDVALLGVLESMGATIEWRSGGVGSNRASLTPLKGCTVDLSGMPDMALTIAALAAIADSPTTMLSTSILRYKESDRLNAIMVELTKIGAAVSVSDDGDTLTIVPARQLQPAAIHTYDDHRMAMAFGLLTLVEPRITIVDPGCVSKTWPQFFSELKRYAAAGAT
jgi:3-phosphoshikimate 1-carboxyvinyltransferase